MRVRDIMVRDLVTIGEDESLETAARRMLDKRIGCLVVTSAEGKCPG